MTVFLLTWNPDGSGWPDVDYGRQVERLAAGGLYKDRWSVGGRKHGIGRGDRAYLMRQRHERGLVACGTISSRTYEDDHWGSAGARTRYVNIDWSSLLPIEDRLPVELLKAELPEVSWDRLQGSGVRVPSPHDAALTTAWSKHLQASPYREPDELPLGQHEEGAVTRVEVNRYERDRAARAACITHYGTLCAVCGFDFEARYGRLGRGFIQVHHVRELSTLGRGYMIDPVADLRPLCANCHAMVHRSRPALTPRQLKSRLRKT